jgi:hypothetical protein
VKFGRRGTSYAGAAEPSVDAERLADFRVRSARACHAWQELDAADLVQRGRGYLVSASTDEVFRSYKGDAFSAGGQIVSDQQPLAFTVRDGDVRVLERQPGTWSERIYEQQQQARTAR